jgi:replicative DNA helicase
MSKAAKRLAQELECSVILVSQFNREAEAGVEPKIDMLRDTGQLENDCDWAILMWEIKGDAPQDNRKVGMRVAKNRGGKRGDLVHSFFNPSVNRFVDALT